MVGLDLLRMVCTIAQWLKTRKSDSKEQVLQKSKLLLLFIIQTKITRFRQLILVFKSEFSSGRVRVFSFAHYNDQTMLENI